MLSSSARRRFTTYSLRGGMRNIAWIAGWMVSPGKDGFSIMNNRFLNHNAFIEYRPGTVPVNFRENQKIKAMCRVLGGMKGDQHVLRLELMRAEVPDIQDMPPEKPFRVSPPPNVPVNALVPPPEDFPPNEGEASLVPNGLTTRPTEKCNTVQLAGYVGFLGPIEDGPRGGGKRFVFGLQQTPEIKEAIPVVVANSKEAASLRNMLFLGAPVYVEGHFNCRVVSNTEIYPYVRTMRLLSADIGLGAHIEKEPQWAADLRFAAAGTRRRPMRDSKEESAPAPVVDAETTAVLREAGYAV